MTTSSGSPSDGLQYHVYVPSKGRASTCTTPRHLAASGIDFSIVVEPQDAHDYRYIFGESSVVVMPENDKGLWYARNECKKHSMSQGHRYHWQIDDDVKYFRIRRGNKNHKCSAFDALSPVERETNKYKNIGAAGIKHSLYAWSAKNEIDYNKQICSVGLFKTDSDIWWREMTVEDTDYSLQLLNEGLCTILFNRLIYDPPTNGSNEGGCSAEGIYGGDTGDSYLPYLRGLQKSWPGVFRIVRKKGKPRLAPNRVWGGFRQRPELT